MEPCEANLRRISSEQIVFVLFCTLWLLNIMQHVPSFYRTNFLGDENVYLSIAHDMGWDCSRYTTMHMPAFKDWPNSIYQQPLFHHGPVLPYVLKIGAEFKAPVAAAMVFANLCMAVFFLQIRRLMLILGIPPAWRVFAYVGAATGPLLLFSTTRLHHDAIAGLLIASGLIAFVDAIQTNSKWRAVGSGLLLSLALNSRFNAILVLPVLVGFQFYALCIAGSPDTRKSNTGILCPAWKFHLRDPKRWVVFLIVATIVATIGMQHFYRLLATYGTLNPKSFMIADPNDRWVQTMWNRTRWQMLLSLIALLPILLMFMSTSPYKSLMSGLRKGSWAPAFAFSCLFFFAVTYAFVFRELRHYALATPLLYCCLPYFFMNSSGRRLSVNVALAVVMVFSNIWTANVYLVVVKNQVAWIVPSIYQYLPFLMPLYGPIGVSP